jgi:hypothetical protein
MGAGILAKGTFFEAEGVWVQGDVIVGEMGACKMSTQKPMKTVPMY